MNNYFDNEIKSRREVLSKLLVTQDSILVNTEAIHSEINAIILMSKDIENLSAAVSRSKSYFNEVCLLYGFNKDDFASINTGMHIDEIAVIMKQNELNLLNLLIFKSNTGNGAIYTAQ